MKSGTRHDQPQQLRLGAAQLRCAHAARPWLPIFGQTFTRIKAVPTDGIPCIDCPAPGIIARSA